MSKDTIAPLSWVRFRSHHSPASFRQDLTPSAGMLTGPFSSALLVPGAPGYHLPPLLEPRVSAALPQQLWPGRHSFIDTWPGPELLLLLFGSEGTTETALPRTQLADLRTGWKPPRGGRADNRRGLRLRTWAAAQHLEHQGAESLCCRRVTRTYQEHAAPRGLSIRFPIQLSQ